MSIPTDPTDDVLAARMVTAPGVLRAGAGCWDRGRTPIHPLTLESAYADPDLLRALGARGARCAREFGVDVVVGAETGGVPPAAAVSLAGGVPFAFVREPGYRGHEVDEPPVRGASASAFATPSLLPFVSARQRSAVGRATGGTVDARPEPNPGGTERRVGSRRGLPGRSAS